MKKYIITTVSIIAAVALLVVGYFVFVGMSGKTVSTTPGAKLSDQPYAKFAYLVSGDTLSPEAQTALAGFTVQKQPASDGGTDITLKSTQAGGQDLQYHLQKGQQLYFVETSMGDDQGNQEYGMYDDKGVITDANGYIVQ